jgi:hypothetical protein
MIPKDRYLTSSRGLDVASAVMVTFGLALLLLALSKGGQSGWNTLLPITAFGLGAALLLGFALAEIRSASPLVPVELFRSRGLAIASVAMLLKSTSGIAGVFVPTLYFQEILGFSPAESGLALLPGSFAGAVVGLFGARLIALGGARRSAAIGLSVQSAGLMLMASMPLEGLPLLPLTGIVVMVMGLVMSDIGLVIAATDQLPSDQRGLGAGLFRTAAQMGAACGLGVITAVIATYGGKASLYITEISRLVDGLRAGLFVAAGFTGIALLVVLIGLYDRSQ